MRKCFFFIILFAFVSKAHAQEIPRHLAMRIIISEAADQGLRGMVCVAEVLRARGGSTKGFYGYKWNRPDHQPESIWQTAAKAWELSAHTNYTRGADHFENVHRFGHPWWAYHCIETYEYKDHIFYKEVHSV